MVSDSGRGLLGDLVSQLIDPSRTYLCVVMIVVFLLGSWKLFVNISITLIHPERAIFASHWPSLLPSSSLWFYCSCGSWWKPIMSNNTYQFMTDTVYFLCFLNLPYLVTLGSEWMIDTQIEVYPRSQTLDHVMLFYLD